MSVTEQRIRELGCKYLNDEGLQHLEEKLDFGETEQAKILLLGAFDGLWQRNEITDVEARALYKELDISPEEASEVRQTSGKMS